MTDTRSSELILGVDLGTNYSTAAAIIDGKMHFALDGRGEATIPSVVHFPRRGSPVVGIEADKMRGTDPANTVIGVKRIIGKPLDSPSARVFNHSSAVRLKSLGKGEVVIQAESGEYSATEVASFLLRYMRERAEARFQRKITKAVVTVPVTAGPEVRQAMIRCGRMAGMEVTRILTEPIAGALANGPEAVKETPSLMFDFGGGTLDVALVQRVGNQVNVLASGGDESLGGDDLDMAFARWVSERIQSVFQRDLSQEVVTWDRLLRACELVKRALSNAPRAQLSVPEAFFALNKQHDIKSLVQREQLTPIWQELVARSVEAALETLTHSGLPKEKVGQVLLIGGTSFVPQVQQAVTRAFPIGCKVEKDPQTAVARGAAIAALHPQVVAQ